jgi:hypothetical protein
MGPEATAGSKRARPKRGGHRTGLGTCRGWSSYAFALTSPSDHEVKLKRGRKKGKAEKEGQKEEERRGSFLRRRRWSGRDEAYCYGRPPPPTWPCRLWSEKRRPVRCHRRHEQIAVEKQIAHLAAGLGDQQATVACCAVGGAIAAAIIGLVVGANRIVRADP